MGVRIRGFMLRMYVCVWSKPLVVEKVHYWVLKCSTPIYLLKN